MRFLFVVHKNEEKAEQNSVLFRRLTLKERGLRPNGYFPLMRQPLKMNFLLFYFNTCENFSQVDFLLHFRFFFYLAFILIRKIHEKIMMFSTMLLFLFVVTDIRLF